MLAVEHSRDGWPLKKFPRRHVSTLKNLVVICVGSRQYLNPFLVTVCELGRGRSVTDTDKCFLLIRLWVILKYFLRIHELSLIIYTRISVLYLGMILWSFYRFLDLLTQQLTSLESNLAHHRDPPSLMPVKQEKSIKVRVQQALRTMLSL